MKFGRVFKQSNSCDIPLESLKYVFCLLAFILFTHMEKVATNSKLDSRHDPLNKSVTKAPEKMKTKEKSKKEGKIIINKHVTILDPVLVSTLETTLLVS